MDQPTAVTLTYSLSKADLRRALFRSILHYGWYIGFVPLAGVITVAYGLFDPDYDGIIPPGLILIVVGTAYFLVIPLLQARSAAKIPGAFGEGTITFSDEGIAVSGSHSSGRLDWILLKNAWESSSYIFVRFQSAVIVIPKSKIQESDIASLREILLSHATGKVRWKS